MNLPVCHKERSGEILAQLNHAGVVKVPGYLPQPQKLIEEVERSITDQGKQGYEFGQNVRFQSVYRLGAYPEIRRTFSDPWMKDLTAQYLKGRHDFACEVFITHEFRTDRGKARNGFLHFDRTRAFKFMLYLSEVEEDCGPFTCVPGTHLKGREMRTAAWKRTRDYGEVKNRIDLDYGELGITREDHVPVTGPPGTLIVFDSDVFHMGGNIEPGKARLIIRSHSRLKSERI